jgi:hypothetical protein
LSRLLASGVAHLGDVTPFFSPEPDGSMFVADRDGAYREILCVQEERQVGNDNTVSWKGRRLQIPRARCDRTS